MEQVNIDIQKNPPTPERLAQWRRDTAEAERMVKQRERWFVRTGYGIGLTGLAVSAGLWSLGYGGEVAGMAVLLAATAITVASVSASAIASAVAAGVLVMLTIVMGAGLMVTVVAVAIAAGGLGAYSKYIDTPREQADRLLADLQELNAEEHPDACIEYDSFREKSATVARYHAQIAAQGRRPVVLEYKAAKRWVETSGQRRREEAKIEAARQACARMVEVGS